MYGWFGCVFHSFFFCNHWKINGMVFFCAKKKRTDTRSSSVMSQIMGAANLTLHRWEELNAVPPYPAPQKQRVCVLMFHCVFPLLPKSCRSTQNPMCVCFVVVRGCQRGRGRGRGGGGGGEHWMDGSNV